MKVFDPDDTNELIKGWKLHAVKARRKHEEAARRLDTKRYLIGVLAIILSTIAGASVIASIHKKFGDWVPIIVGLGSIAASILASLQTFLGYGERAERHRAASVEYKVVIRALEEKKALTSAAPSCEKIDHAIEKRKFLFEKSAHNLHSKSAQ